MASRAVRSRWRPDSATRSASHDRTSAGRDPGSALTWAPPLFLTAEQRLRHRARLPHQDERGGVEGSARYATSGPTSSALNWCRSRPTTTRRSVRNGGVRAASASAPTS